MKTNAPAMISAAPAIVDRRMVVSREDWNDAA
jgi:hypothetical protein